MSAVIYNLDDTYDLELQVFKYGENYGAVRFYSVHRSRRAELGFTQYIAQESALDYFEGRSALWVEDAPKVLVLKLGQDAPDAQWLKDLAALFPDSLRVIVTDPQNLQHDCTPDYLCVHHTAPFLSSGKQASSFFGLMTVCDLATSDVFTRLGTGDYRMEGIPSSPAHGHLLSLSIDSDDFNPAARIESNLPSRSRLARLDLLKNSVGNWLNSENTSWQQKANGLRDSAVALYEKAQSFSAKPPSRLGTFTEIAQADQADLVSSAAIEQQWLHTVLAAKDRLCEVSQSPLLVKGFRVGLRDCPNAYQQQLRTTQSAFMPGLSEFLTAAGRLVSQVSSERRARLRDYESKEIPELNRSLTESDRCNPDELLKKVDELEKTTTAIERSIADIESENANEYLFSTDDVDHQAIHGAYNDAYRAAAKLASVSWLLVVTLMVMALSSVPVIDRRINNSTEYASFDAVYLIAIAALFVAGLLFVARRLRAEANASAYSYELVLLEQFTRKDRALCQFVRYLLLSAALRRLKLIIAALHNALAQQKIRIKQGSQIQQMVAQVLKEETGAVSTTQLLPVDWAHYLEQIHQAAKDDEVGTGVFKIHSGEREVAIVEFPWRLFPQAQQGPVLVGDVDHAIAG